MQVETYDFNNEFASLIKGVWTIEFSEEEQYTLNDIVIPTGFIDVIFSYRDDYYLIDKDVTTKIPKILIAGQSDHALQIEYGINTKLVGMLVTPIGFLSIFNLTSAPYKNSITNGGAPEWNLTEIYSKLQSLEKIEDIAFCVKEYFNIISSKNLDRLYSIIKIIDNSNGEISIKKLASINNLSESAFVRYFKKNTGITPKAYSIIIKFKYSLSNQKLNVNDSYYDQSHLIKNCKRYTGKTPKELLVSSKEITLDYILKNADFLQYFDTN